MTFARGHVGVAAAAVLLAVSVAGAQTSNDPFAAPIAATDGVITVGAVEFAALPDFRGETARMMRLVDEPGTGRLFVSDMWGLVYTVSYDGGTVTRYLDLTDARWAVDVHARGRERGFQSFALHPQFAEAGAPGYGKLYAWTDSSNTAPPADFTPGGGSDAHDTILLEWTAADAASPVYDGGPPRELMRVEQPFGNHNGGQLAFNPLAAPGDPDFGLLYVGSADGGSGGDPLDLSQDLGSIFGKVLRIDPLGSNSANGRVRHTRRQSLSRATATMPPSARSTPTGCGTRSASRGTRGTATCSSPTSGRTSSRRSARCGRAPTSAGTTGRGASGSSAAAR